MLRVLFVFVVVEVFHLFFVLQQRIFGLSNIKQASCSQGTITHRIPFFDGEAIAKKRDCVKIEDGAYRGVARATITASCRGRGCGVCRRVRLLAPVRVRRRA